MATWPRLIEVPCRGECLVCDRAVTVRYRSAFPVSLTLRLYGVSLWLEHVLEASRLGAA